MAQQLELPDVGEGIAEGEIISWLVEPGDYVEEDQILAEVETDKAVVDLPSPFEGTIAQLHAEEGDIVAVGSVIVTFEDEGAEAAAASPSGTVAGTETADAGTEAEEASSEPAASEQPAAQSVSSPASDEGHTASEGDDTPATTAPESHVFAPPRVRRLARELDVDLRTIASSNGAHPISETDVRRAAGQLESAQSDNAAPAATETVTEDGQTGDEPAAGEPEPASESTHAEQSTANTASQPRPVSGPAAGREKTLAAPATRQLARELGVDIDDVPTDAHRDGTAFVEPEHVEAFASAAPNVSAADSEQLSEPEQQTPSGMGATTADDSGPEERVPYRGIRKAIGDNMEEAKFNAPHVSHHDSTEIEQLVSTREKLNDRLDAEFSITYLPFVIKAVTSALNDFPYMNASLDKEAGEIVLKEHYDIGIATATDRGLVVPVIENADQKGVRQLAQEIADLTSRARSNDISPDEMQGSTFTITNFGAIGGDYATPIINYPEAAILGLGAIKRRPVVDDGAVVARHTLPLSLSVDHRLIDGAVAAKFTNQVKTYLNAPEMLML